MRIQSPAPLIIETTRDFLDVYLKYRNINLLVIPKHIFLQYEKEINA